MMYVKSRDTTKTITNASTLILGPDNQRRGVAISNSSTSVVWLAKGPTATANQGIFLNASGGNYTDERGSDGSIYTGPYAAIAVTAGSNVIGIQEDYFEN